MIERFDHVTVVVRDMDKAKAFFGLLGFAGLVYGAVALACGAIMLALAWRVYRERTGPAAASAAKKLFAFSLLYVFVVFAALLLDHTLAQFGWLA